MRSSPAPSLPRWRLALYALLPAALLFGVPEVALRVFGFEYRPIPTHLQFGPNLQADIEREAAVPDPVLFWRPRVGPRTARALIARRFVHPALTRATGAFPHPPSTVRIVSMGDSCTFFGSPPYPSRLQQILRARDIPADVFNAGVPGYTSFQGRRWFDPEIAGYRPDWVTLYYGWNDHWLALVATDRRLAEEQTPGSVAAQRLMGHVRILQAAAWLRARVSRRPPEARPLRVPPEDYRSNLDALCRAAEAAGARVILITAPADLDPQDVVRLRSEGYVAPATDVLRLHDDYNRIVREVAAARGARLVDFAALTSPGDGTISEDGIHLTRRGDELLATRLADVVTGEKPPESGP